ncbi:MAG: pilus (MSHA type) biogenesis protein MshL [Methylotenera sp.]|nr:pilus (MSHA type) biogenesis protein MshL [Methylotenera sp.]MDP1958802.1 pilus (MSHA type) biogenesis protein MshL [Methylotenera sp.]MDP3302621.1 pilus (MSHA type) biogenesis protein MshL [Methylotenera sp.]MDP3943375.1 pilus (MSHA type) biogenesis protein MshL [Methylotenera sp.]
MATNKKILSLLCIALGLGVSSCAHESKVQPSKGHIDGQNAPKSPVASTSASDPATSSAIPKPVTSSTYLPPPKPKAKEPVYSIVVYDTPVKEVLFAIARDSKLNVDIHPSIQGRVTLNAVDQTLPAILERLSKQVDLTYKVQGNVLTITPDQPVLRTYKVDYVNMARDTMSSIGAAAEITTTGRAAAAGAQSGRAAGSGGGLSANGSRTQVSSESKNHFWETLIQNIRDLLAETDKEVIVSRFGSITEVSAKNTPSTADSDTKALSQTEIAKANTEQRDQQKSEYKTLFAANVIANPEAGVISVRGTNKQHERVQEFLDRVLTSANRQVLIEATIVEVELKDSYQAGVDWSRFSSGGNAANPGNGFTFSQTLNPTVADPLNPIALSSFKLGYKYTGSGFLADIAGALTLLQQFGDTKVLSSPKLTVLNNQTAVLKVVDNLVYFTIEAQQSTVGGAVGGTLATFTSTPQTVPVGVVMSVTPQINDVKSVMLNVRPTITRFVSSVQDPNPNLVSRDNAGNITGIIQSKIPIIQTREMESLLRVDSGETTILGGLMQDDIKNNIDAVPGVSDVPVLGRAFKANAKLNKKSELIIFLRPTVITHASLESDELASYNQYLPSRQMEKALDGER